MDHMLIGNHPAVDFLNTAYLPEERRVETLGDGRALVHWLVAAELITEESSTRLTRRIGAKALDAAAADARKLRDWAREWLGRWRAAPSRDYSNEMAVINKHLAGLSFHHRISAHGGEVTLTDDADLQSTEALMGLLALQIARLVTAEDPALLKHCAGAECTLWFLDQTKAHRRLFCSTSACGNRAKVAAFRKRQRQ